MSTTNIINSGLKESTKNTGIKFKDYANQKYQAAKTYGNKYRDDIRTAYDVGFSKGWEDAYDIPNRFCAKLAAAYGYRKGVKCRYKSDRFIKQYNRKSNNK